MYAINQGSMSLATFWQKYGHHLARLCYRCRRAHPPTSNTASHDNHQKINPWVFFSFLYGYAAPGQQSAAITILKENNFYLMTPLILFELPNWDQPNCKRGKHTSYTVKQSCQLYLQCHRPYLGLRLQREQKEKVDIGVNDQ